MAKEKADKSDDGAAAESAVKPFIARRMGLIAVAVIVGALAFAGAQMLKRPQYESGRVGTPAIGGPFTLVDHEGRAVTDRDFRGRFMLVFFGYTFCPDVCPTTLTEVANAVDMLGDKGAGVVPVFITVDPERDTPGHLKEYLSYFHPATVGLTGTPDQVAAAVKAYKAYFKKQPAEGGDPGDYLMDHTATVYLMGPDGKFVVHFSNGTAADVMAEKIREHL